MMNPLLQQLKNPKNKLSLILLATVIFFMQCYLLQHKVEHQTDHHFHEDTHTVIQDCQLCLGADKASQFILPSFQHLSLSLLGLFLITVSFYVALTSFSVLLPPTRAPPAF